MESVISYRPRMGKRKLESLVKNKLRYKSVNQFIDHAVTKTLREEFGHHPLAKKIAEMVYRVVAEHVELRFARPSAAEAREIDEIAKVTMAREKTVPAMEILRRSKKS